MNFGPHGHSYIFEEWPLTEDGNNSSLESILPSTTTRSSQAYVHVARSNGSMPLGRSAQFAGYPDNAYRTSPIPSPGLHNVNPQMFDIHNHHESCDWQSPEEHRLLSASHFSDSAPFEPMVGNWHRRRNSGVKGTGALFDQIADVENQYGAGYEFCDVEQCGLQTSGPSLDDILPNSSETYTSLQPWQVWSASSSHDKSNSTDQSFSRSNHSSRSWSSITSQAITSESSEQAKFERIFRLDDWQVIREKTRKQQPTTQAERDGTARIRKKGACAACKQNKRRVCFNSLLLRSFFADDSRSVILLISGNPPRDIDILPSKGG